MSQGCLQGQRSHRSSPLQVWGEDVLLDRVALQLKVMGLPLQYLWVYSVGGERLRELVDKYPFSAAIIRKLRMRWLARRAIISAARSEVNRRSGVTIMESAPLNIERSTLAAAANFGLHVRAMDAEAEVEHRESESDLDQIKDSLASMMKQFASEQTFRAQVEGSIQGASAPNPYLIEEMA